jgi:hypothetical protein|tara:strand:- start:395 stop:664 length:270 start_codon:yes stop_codon:yes gene_type:complete
MEKHYWTKKQRKAIVEKQLAKGMKLMNDDFHTGPVGENGLLGHTLIFEVRPPGVVDEKYARTKTLRAKLSDDTATLANIKELMRLERGL